ncbi:MAG TPA: ATP-binding protein [Pirellulaceae bacterium]|nr:ATP-binding protein [Pirellulaceae bacterium]
MNGRFQVEGGGLEHELREINEALIVSLIHQHELTDQAERAEAKMRESEERYRTLFDLGPVAIYSIDTSGMIREFNRHAATLWGREPALGDADERLFCGSLRMFRPDGSYMPHHECPMAEVVSGAISEVRDAEVIIERPDGSRATVVMNIRPLKSQRGEITGAVNCFYDITGRKNSEEAARQSQEHLRRNVETFSKLVEQSPFGLYTVDSQFRIAHVSDGAQDAFRSVRPLIGRDFADAIRIIWPAPVAQQIIDTFRHTLETGEPYLAPSLTEQRHDIETLESYEWQIHRVTMPDGQLGVVCYFFDATRLRQAENALRETDRRKNEFLATLAHELRNPLAPIRNSLHLLKSEDVPARGNARDMIERQVNQLVRLVDDLLELSRIESGKIELRRKPLEVADVIRAAIETSKPLIDAAGHTLTTSLPAEPLIVEADAVRLTQSVANLLNNAAKYTDRGGQIWLSAARHDDQVVLSVRDNGIGLSASMIPKLFQMFFQGDREQGRAQGGLGIGLALVKRLVELHQGSIEARSGGPGQGSEFVIRLPLAPGALVAEARPVGGQSATGKPKTCRVLVVDDNRDSANSLARLLQRSGYEAETAYDGEQAINAAAALKPDVVLLDIGMPKLDGYQAAQRIRQQPWAGNVMLIALTGWGQEDDRRRAEQAGFNHHLVKPVELAVLMNLLESQPACSAR